MLSLNQKAEKSGFLAGDIIVQIEDIEIKNFSNIETALKSTMQRLKEFM